MAQFSIITPVFNPPLWAFEECIKSVLGQKFEEIIQRLEELENSDPRIRVIHRSTNGGITQASNDALGIASGNYIALLDHDDSLALEALEIVNNVIVLSPGADYIYSDEDKINEDGVHFDEFRKPDWAPERLLGQNYCCHLSVFRHSLVKQVGGFRTGFEGSQDYDLILRVSELSTYIHHIPKVLYHWRVVQGSAAGEQFAKPYAIEAARKAVEEHLKRTSVEATVTSTAHGYQKVIRRLHSFPKVSIVIPSAAYSRTVWGEECLLLDECLKSILQKSTYPNYEVIVVLDNNAFRENASLKETMNDERIVVVDYEKPFNFSDKCNLGAVAASGEMLLFLNDDTEVITPDWLEILVGHLSDPGVGAVGARLLLEDGTIQSAGHSNNPSPHSFGLASNKDDPGQFGALAIAQERSGITGACLGMQRDLYLLVGGMSLDFPHCFNDVDLCFKILELKKRLIWTPFADLFHFESLSRNPTPRDEELEAIYERWSRYFGEDRYLPLRFPA
jgi:glycosyltransferase involved in cell wall biosynthesis